MQRCLEQLKLQDIARDAWRQFTLLLAPERLPGHHLHHCLLLQQAPVVVHLQDKHSRHVFSLWDMHAAYVCSMQHCKHEKHLLSQGVVNEHAAPVVEST